MDGTMKESMVSFLNKYLGIGLAKVRCAIKITPWDILIITRWDDPWK
jgi:hypothetical protein